MTRAVLLMLATPVFVVAAIWLLAIVVAGSSVRAGERLARP